MQRLDINSERVLRNFVYGIMKFTLKNAVEYQGLHESLWNKKTDKPLHEPEAQPIVFNQFTYPLHLKGVHITRESIIANGKLDFYCTYRTSDGKPLKVCIEMKNAHHDDLLKGLQKQLPAYMRGEKTNHGIFLVMWYKDKQYPHPKKYADIAELENHLKANMPPKLRIDIMIVDCGEKIAPSKLK